MSPKSSTNPCNTGSTPSDIFYRGARRDAATGQYQFGERTYDPNKASFLTPDAYRAGPSTANLRVSADPLTANRYSYVNGDPVNLVDPTGHTPCEANESWNRAAGTCTGPAQPAPCDQACQDQRARNDSSKYVYGGRPYSTKTYHIDPQKGKGEVDVNLFIQDSNPCALGDKGDTTGYGFGCGKGDDRGYGQDHACVHSRACIHVNYETGEVTVIAAPSCTGAGSDQQCHAPFAVGGPKETSSMWTMAAMA